MAPTSPHGGLGDGDGGGGSVVGSGSGADVVGVVVGPPPLCVGEPLGVLLPLGSVDSASRSAASAEAGDVGVGVELATTGAFLPLTPGSVADAVSVVGASPRVNVTNAATAIMATTAPVMIRGQGLLYTGGSSCASTNGSVPSAPIQAIGRERPDEIFRWQIR